MFALAYRVDCKRISIVHVLVLLSAGAVANQSHTISSHRAVILGIQMCFILPYLVAKRVFRKLSRNNKTFLPRKKSSQ